MWELARLPSSGGHGQGHVPNLSPCRGASPGVPLPAKKVPVVRLFSSPESDLLLIISEGSVCVTRPSCQELFWALPPAQMLLSGGCFGTFFHAVHRTDLVFWLICKTDSLAGIQVLCRDVPSFISNEQIAGVLGKGKEARHYLNCLYFFFFCRGYLPKDNSMPCRMALWLHKYLYI